jgi:hypothetical protein
LSTRDLHFELRADPNPHLAYAVRRFIEAQFERPVADDQELVGRLSMAAHELVENSVEYAAGPPVVVRIALLQETSEAGARIALTNEADPAHIERLRRFLADIAAWGDDRLTELYQAYLRKCDGTDGWGLGLARIRAEAEMRLESEIAGSTVTVTATTEGGRGARAGLEVVGGEAQLSAVVDDAEGILNVRLVGTADLEFKPRFDERMRAVHAQALRHRVRQVVVDLRRTVFMNSSCLKVVVTWILDSQYRITFVQNPAQLWQLHSLRALVALAPDRISVQSRR